MESKTPNKYAFIFRFVIERYEDRCPQMPDIDTARKAVVDWTGKLIQQARQSKEQTVVSMSDYFDIVAVSAYDRYAEDEDDGEDYGDEDRWSVEMVCVARYTVESTEGEKKAMASLSEYLGELCEDVAGDTVEEFATNLSFTDIHNNRC